MKRIKEKIKKEDGSEINDIKRQLVSQEHRIYHLVKNYIEYSSLDRNDPVKKAARNAILWRIFSPGNAIIIGAGIVSILTLIVLYEQNALIKEQNCFSIRSDQEIQKTTMIDVLYQKTGEVNSEPKHSSRARADAFLDYISSFSSKDNELNAGCATSARWLNGRLDLTESLMKDVRVYSANVNNVDISRSQLGNFTLEDITTENLLIEDSAFSTFNLVRVKSSGLLMVLKSENDSKLSFLGGEIVSSKISIAPAISFEMRDVIVDATSLLGVVDEMSIKGSALADSIIGVPIEDLDRFDFFEQGIESNPKPMAILNTKIENSSLTLFSSDVEIGNGARFNKSFFHFGSHGNFDIKVSNSEFTESRFTHRPYSREDSNLEKVINADFKNTDLSNVTVDLISHENSSTYFSFYGSDISDSNIYCDISCEISVTNSTIVNTKLEFNEMDYVQNNINLRDASVGIRSLGMSWRGQNDRCYDENPEYDCFADMGDNFLERRHVSIFMDSSRLTIEKIEIPRSVMPFNEAPLKVIATGSSHIEINGDFPESVCVTEEVSFYLNGIQKKIPFSNTNCDLLVRDTILVSHNDYNYVVYSFLSAYAQRNSNNSTIIALNERIVGAANESGYIYERQYMPAPGSAEEDYDHVDEFCGNIQTRDLGFSYIFINDDNVLSDKGKLCGLIKNVLSETLSNKNSKFTI